MLGQRQRSHGRARAALSLVSPTPSPREPVTGGVGPAGARASAAVTCRGPPRALRVRRTASLAMLRGREGGEGPARPRRQRWEKREGWKRQHLGIRPSGHASRVDPHTLSGPDGTETLAGMETWSRRSLK